MQRPWSQPRPRLGPRWISAAALLLLLISVGAFLIIRLRIRAIAAWQGRGEENLRVTPLTTLPGREVFPSFSPDGSQVAFAWDGGNSNATNPFNLYVKAVGSEKVEQLTHLTRLTSSFPPGLLMAARSLLLARVVTGRACFPFRQEVGRSGRLPTSTLSFQRLCRLGGHPMVGSLCIPPLKASAW